MDECAEEAVPQKQKYTEHTQHTESSHLPHFSLSQGYPVGKAIFLLLELISHYLHVPAEAAKRLLLSQWALKVPVLQDEEQQWSACRPFCALPRLQPLAHTLALVCVSSATTCACRLARSL